MLLVWMHAAETDVAVGSQVSSVQSLPSEQSRSVWLQAPLAGVALLEAVAEVPVTQVARCGRRRQVADAPALAVAGVRARAHIAVVARIGVRPVAAEHRITGVRRAGVGVGRAGERRAPSARSCSPSSGSQAMMPLQTLLSSQWRLRRRVLSGPPHDAVGADVALLTGRTDVVVPAAAPGREPGF